MRLEIPARLCQFLIFELRGKCHEPSRAENPSARAMTRASSARTYHSWVLHHLELDKIDHLSMGESELSHNSFLKFSGILKDGT